MKFFNVFLIILSVLFLIKFLGLAGMFGSQSATIIDVLLFSGIIGSMFVLRKYKRAQKTLSEQEAKYQRLFHHVNDAIFITELSVDWQLKKTIDVNRVACDSLGYSKSELLEISPSEIILPEGIRNFQRIREKLIKKGQASFESTHMTKEGQRLVVEVNSRVITYQGKKALLSVARDITHRKEIERSLEESRQQFESFFTYHSDAIFSLAPSGNFININPHGEWMTGYSKSELSNMTFVEIIAPEHISKTVEHFLAVLEGKKVSLETVLVSKEGKRIELSISAVPIQVDSQIIGVTGIARDITLELQNEKLLKESEQRFKSLFEHNIDAVLTFDLEGNFVSMNAATEKLMGFSSNELLDRSFLPFIVLEEREKTFEHFSKAIKGTPHQYETAMLNKNGERVDLHISLIPVYVDRTIIGIHCIGKDITERKKTREKIRHMAFHDPLTGLANRIHFEKQVEHLLKDALLQERTVAIMFLDLDRFKLINDSFGHRIGDLFLQKLSQRLQECVREKGLLCRQGGDEFLFLLNELNQEETIKVAQSIMDTLSKPFEVAGHELVTTPSLGISFYPAHGENAETLIQKADAAMYQAKRQGKNQYQIYDPSQISHSSQLLEMEANLRRALKQQEFILHYQPQIDLKTNTVTGVEALIRWNHPELGFISPSEFIPLAEETGLIISIGEWLLREACKQNKLWQEQGLPPMVMSVNLSIRQFYQPDLIPMIEGILRETGLHPKYLELEITETMAMSIEEAASVIQSLKNLGVKIAIDDFGTGYSSLNYLKNLPIDRLKIDQSFVRDIVESESNDKDIVATIITMGHNLRLKVIAEGVETVEQLNFLKENQCDEAQGYLFSRPVTADEYVRYFKEIS